MENCDQDYDDECVVKYGETAVGKLYFTSSGAVDSSLDCKIYGNVGGIWLDFPGDCPVADGCGALEKGDCPLEAGEEIIYDIALDIASFFPPVNSDYFSSITLIHYLRIYDLNKNIIFYLFFCRLA